MRAMRSRRCYGFPAVKQGKHFVYHGKSRANVLASSFAARTRPSPMHNKEAKRRWRAELRAVRSARCDDTWVFSMSELNRALAHLHNGKATGKEQLPAELYKHLPCTWRHALLHTLQ
eukprot:6462851-Amphidinium_carterae.1